MSEVTGEIKATVGSSYSLTQGGNLAALVGLINIVLKYFNISIASDEVSTILIGIGIVISWIGRYRQGDLKLSGFRK